jgi:hypothetical protein
LFAKNSLNQSNWFDVFIGLFLIFNQLRCWFSIQNNKCRTWRFKR